MDPSPPTAFPPSPFSRPWLRRLGLTVFLLLVAALLFRQAQQVAWAEVWSSALVLPPARLLACAALTAASHLLYSSFDLLGRHHTGHRLSVALVLRLTLISYAFNLNLGSWIGGVAFRYRLYARQGLAIAHITQIMALSMVSNWLGYLSLAGLLLLCFPLQTPARWSVDPTAVRLLGLGLLAMAMAYPVYCAAARRRTLTLRGHVVTLPGWRLALLQAVLGAGNWLLMGSVVHGLIPAGPDFHTVMTVLLLSAMAGVLTHIPAGMGVLEAVFMAWFSPPADRHALLAALLVYRFLYYLFPLGLAVLLYIQTEMRPRAGAGGTEKPLHG